MIRIRDKNYGARLIVFDKDGLLFKSMPFWISLLLARTEAFQEKFPDPDLLTRWYRMLGVEATFDSLLRIERIWNKGHFATASIPEEIMALAGFLCFEDPDLSWIEAKVLAEEIMDRGDEIFDFEASLVPQPGFPDIFQRLRLAGIPYGIATSDTYDRTITSIDLYDKAGKLDFIVTPDDVTLGKPHPDMLLHISELMEVPPGEMLMVGDSIVDMLMAQRAGAIGVAIPEIASDRPVIAQVASLVIDSLDEIVF